MLASSVHGAQSGRPPTGWEAARLQPPYGHNRTWFARGALPRTRDRPMFRW